MLKILVLFFSLVMSSAAFADGKMNAFLKKHYGWTLELEEKSIFEWRWKIVCHPSRQALPLPEKEVVRNPICHQRDRAYWTVISWRLPAVPADDVTGYVFKGMAGMPGKEGNPLSVFCSCASDGPFSAGGKDRGFIEDCSVTLPNGRFFVSFFHFDAETPAPYQVKGHDGEIKSSNGLAFTIWVQNAGDSNPGVKEKLRELVTAVRFPTP